MKAKSWNQRNLVDNSKTIFDEKYFENASSYEMWIYEYPRPYENIKSLKILEYENLSTYEHKQIIVNMESFDYIILIKKF